MMPALHIVTGAFGYSGQYVARRLLDAGLRVRTLTNSPHRSNPFGDRIDVHPLCFDEPERLADAMRGADVLYNTYWVRFNHPLFKHSDAIDNTLRLFDAARNAGVRRLVHVSITNPSLDSPLEYFRGKALLERALIESGLSHAILRPAVLFGHEDILINNIAWMLRTFPFFGVFGDGSYRLQPIFVDDLAELAVELGSAQENRIVDAIGPQTFTYRNLVEQIGTIIGHRRPIISLPPSVGYWIGRALGVLVRDVVTTREEIEGLMAELLYTDSAPAGPTRLTDWAREHADTLGRTYANELTRRRDRIRPYQDAHD